MPAAPKASRTALISHRANGGRSRHLPRDRHRPDRYEQRALIAMVVDAIPLDALSARPGVRPGAICNGGPGARPTIRREWPLMHRELA